MVGVVADYLKARRHRRGRHVLFVGSGARIPPDEIPLGTYLHDTILECHLGMWQESLAKRTQELVFKDSKVIMSISAGLSDLLAERVEFKTTKVKSAGVNPAGKLTSIIAGIGQQLAAGDQADQVRPGDRRQLQRVPVGELPQELPQRRRRVHLAEQPRHPTGSHLVEIVDAVRPGGQCGLLFWVPILGQDPAGWRPARATRLSLIAIGLPVYGAIAAVMAGEGQWLSPAHSVADIKQGTLVMWAGGGILTALGIALVESLENQRRARRNRRRSQRVTPASLA